MRPAPPRTGPVSPTRDPQPSGDGERTMPEKKAGFSYSVQNGFKMIDWPLGPDAPRSLSAALANAGFATKPSMVVGNESASAVRIECYERGNTVEWLIVIFTAGLDQLVLANNFISMMEAVEKWREVILAAGVTPPADASAAVLAAQPVPGVTTQPDPVASAAGVVGLAAPPVRRYTVLGDARRVIVSGVTLKQALAVAPKESAEIVEDAAGGRQAYRWTGNGWEESQTHGPGR